MLENHRLALVVAREGTAESVATGYFILSDLVLTVAHVDDGFSAATFRVRTNPDIDTLGGEDPWRDATEAWRGKGDVDALLLRTTARGGDWEPVPLEKVALTGQWTSKGFALAMADEASGERNTKFVSGRLSDSTGQLPTTLDLTTDQAMHEGRDVHWKGISGAPVFTDSGGVLAGIITGGDRGSPNALSGLPLHRLLDDEGFQREVAPRDLGHLPDRPFCLVLTTETARTPSSTRWGRG